MNPEYNPFQPQQPPVQPYESTPTPTPTPYEQPVGAVNSNYVVPASPVSTKKWPIIAAVFIFTTILASGAAAWASVNYFEQKADVDAKVSSAVAVAVKESRDSDAALFEKKEKEPNRIFVGPEDYGRLSFDYPKTWGAYEAKSISGSNGTYEVYFNPGVIPTASSGQRYALRLMIEDKDYDKVVDSYSGLVKKGDLKSSSVSIGDQTGVRLEGNFTKDIRGSAVIIKIRDKTATLRTDADVFTDDFNKLIETITFNK